MLVCATQPVVAFWEGFTCQWKQFAITVELDCLRWLLAEGIIVAAPERSAVVGFAVSVQVSLRGPTVLATHYEGAINCIHALFEEKARCQKPDNDEAADVDDGAEEHDFVVIDTVGGACWILALCMGSMSWCEPVPLRFYVTLPRHHRRVCWRNEGIVRPCLAPHHALRSQVCSALKVHHGSSNGHWCAC